MKIGIYPTNVPNTGLGKEAWQCFEIDDADQDGGRVLAYFHEDTTKEKIGIALKAMHPDAELEWMDS